MTITRLALKNFTVFADAKFAFCPGINVLIGANASGKTHVLKLLYASRTAPPDSDPAFIADILRTFFGARTATCELLQRHGGAAMTSSALVLDADGQENFATLWTRPPHRRAPDDTTRPACPAVFLPPRDVLATSPGFAGADAIHDDLCRRLSAPRLHGKAGVAFAALLAPLERALGGEVVLADDGLRIRGPEHDVPAPLLADGWRKLATLAWLIANGSLTKGSVLFLDDPEASLDPTLTILLVDTLRRLAHAGVQIFLASHDSLLVHRLSRAAEHALEPHAPMRFFALHRREPGAPVEVETADTLTQIEHDAILAEFARYDDEQRDTPRELATPPPKPGRKKAAKAKKPGSKKPTKKKSSKRA